MGPGSLPVRRIWLLFVSLIIILLACQVSIQQGIAKSSPAEGTPSRPAPTIAATMATPAAKSTTGQETRLFGVNFINSEHWQDYQLPAARLMKINTVKINLYYDCDNCPSGISPPYFTSQDLDDLLNLGVATVIIRTADTRNTPNELAWQLGQDLGNNQTILTYIEGHPAITFWLEVGNEPDQGKQPADNTEQNLLAVSSEIIAPLRRLTNLYWMLPAPSQLHPDYAVTLLKDGKLIRAYDAVAVHTYGAYDLDRADPAQPYLVFDAIQPYLQGKPIIITEAGINSASPWVTKAQQYVQASRSLPSNVAGWIIFTLSLDPYWCYTTRYTVDVYPAVNADGHRVCQIDTSFPAARLIGQR